MAVLRLNNDIIQNGLVCPNGKRRHELCDSMVRGLYLELRSTSPGKATYYLRHRNAKGRTAHARLGCTSDTSLEEARQKAKTLKAEITLGKYPGDEQTSKTTALTFTEYFMHHYIVYVQPRKRTWAKDLEYYRLRLKAEFGDLPLEKITRHQIMTFHTRLKTEDLAASTCNHYIKLMEHALNLAVEWDMLEKNPATKIPLFHEDNQVEHYLDPDELERLLTVLRKDKNRVICLIILWLLSTGARLNEALRAKWEDVDRERRVWRIPASNSKSRRVRSVPLNTSALNVLKQLDTEGEFEWLFVNRSRGRSFVTIQKVWERLRKKAGLSYLRLHDLRHNHASIMINSGRTLYEVQQVLGHLNPKVTRRYSHLSTETLQEASDCVSRALDGSKVKK